jgi:hypothetical protein
MKSAHKIVYKGEEKKLLNCLKSFKFEDFSSEEGGRTFLLVFRTLRLQRRVGALYRTHSVDTLGLQGNIPDV